MALVPYTVTALAESDAEGTGGKNIVAGAVVEFYDAATAGSAQTLYDDAGGTNPSTSKTTDSQGQVTIFIEQGLWWVTINGGTRRAVTIDNASSVVAAIAGQNIAPAQGNFSGDVLTTSGGGAGVYLNGLALSYNRNPSTGAMASATQSGYQWQRTPNATPASDYLDLQVYNGAGAFQGNAIRIAGDLSATFDGRPIYTATTYAAVSSAQGSVHTDSTFGAIHYGNGASYDITLGNRAGNAALGVIANTQDLQAFGNVGIGTAPTVGFTTLIRGASTNVVFDSQNLGGFTMLKTGTANQTMSTAWNGANAAVYVGSDGVTGRSINTAGTVNASGADVAEYVYKSETCGEVAKGDVVGLDADGKVTQKFSESVQFLVKSTNPHTVGGDVWSVTPRPEPIEPETIEYAGVEKPEAILDEDGNDTQDYGQYEADQAAHQQAVADEQARVDAINQANYDEWFAQHEIERAQVDRLAFNGVVPVNFTEGNAGDHLIAVEGDNDTIALVAKPDYESFTDIKNSIGRVKSIDEDGRRRIIVKVG